MDLKSADDVLTYVVRGPEKNGAEDVQAMRGTESKEVAKKANRTRKQDRGKCIPAKDSDCIVTRA